jgi:hypothetical protein
MCVVCISTVTVVSLLSPSTTPVVKNNVTDYTITRTACPKSKVGKIENNKICLKDGKVYRWAIKKDNKSAPTPTTTINNNSNNKNEQPKNTDKFFESLCQVDNEVDKIFENYKNNIKSNNCHPPYKFVSKIIDSSPKTKLSNENVFYSALSCNIDSEKWTTRKNKWHPNYTIRMVPYQTLDFPSTSNPKDDWSFEIKYLLDTFDNLTDVSSNYKIVVDEKYYKVDVNLKDYNLSGKYMHGDREAQTRAKQLANKILSVSDSDIDFSKTDMIYFLPPKNVPNSVLGNFILPGLIQTQEKTFYDGLYMGSKWDDFSSEYWNSRNPFGLIHEIITHVSNTLSDYSGDQFHNNGLGHYGVGNWGNNSGGIMDFLGFDKWQAKLIDDSQVYCINSKQETILWLRPLTHNTTDKKLAVIKLSATTAITIQSMRSSGYNYKLPKNSNGVLVVTIDTDAAYDNTVHDDGQVVLCPKRNNTYSIHGGCKEKNLFDATLQVGESINYKEYIITVLESGEFGDVIKVIKI